MGKLEGRVALVTGGARGIGRGIALAFGGEGAHVGVNYTTHSDAAQRTVKDVQAMGVKAIAIQADVAEVEDVQRMVETMIAQFGRIDILVNNAGICRQIPFTELTVEDFDRMIGVDLRGTFLCCKFVVPYMLKQGYGRIINITSQLAYKGAYNMAHYCAAKAGQVGLTKAMATEFGNCGILVNSIAPGPIDTESWVASGSTGEWERRKLAEVPLHRKGQVEEVAPAAVLLAASPDGDYFQGQSLHPNGGDIMW